MKKILCVLLALCMLTVSCALAEETGKTVVFYDEVLSFGMTVPEGYTLETIVEDGDMLMIFHAEDETAPVFMLYAVPDDSYEGITRLNDMTEEEINTFAQALNEDLSQPEYEVRETGHGTKLLVISETEAEMDIAMIATVYEGCMLITYVVHQDGGAITDADIDLGIQIYTDMEFIVTKK